MGTLGRFVSILFLLLMMISPGWARVVNLEVTAPVPDRSDASVARALKMALDGCVRQAAAMGLSWIRLEDAVLRGEQVVVQMVATDEMDEAAKQSMVPAWDL